MKKPLTLVIILLVAITLGTAYFFYQQKNQTPETNTVVNTKYNPNYADAIQLKKPELCTEINYALRGEPNDAITKLYGAEATTQCESQAKLGYFECECDAEGVLNNMREARVKPQS